MVLKNLSLDKSLAYPYFRIYLEFILKNTYFQNSVSEVILL